MTRRVSAEEVIDKFPDADAYVIVYKPMMQTVSVDGWNNYGDAQTVFEDVKDVVQAYDMLVGEFPEDERNEYEIAGINFGISG